MLKVGFARVDITPPLGTPLHGYFRERFAEGVLDPLELNCVAFSDGQHTAAVMSADLLYIREQVATPIRKLIAKTVGIDEKHLFIHALHQHTSLRLGEKPGVAPTFSDAEYLGVLNRKFCDVVKMAIDDMIEATVGVAKEEAREQLSFIRRYRMKDGTTQTNPGYDRTQEVLHPVGKADNTVRLVRFHREGRPDIALVNFHTHPDVIGGCKFSADWPGFVRRYTEKDIEGCHCILLNGPQGDTNHIDIYDSSKRGYQHSSHMGRVIADSVINLWDKTKAIDAEGVRADVQMIYIPTNTGGMERVEESKKLFTSFQKNELDYSPSLDELGEWSRISNLYDAPLFVKVPVSCVKAGSLAFVGWGGEPFTEYGEKARKSAPDKYVIACCTTNGGEGYLPSQSAFDEGGYEAKSSMFSPVVTSRLQSKAKEMLKD